MPLDTVVVSTGESPFASVIWLHGLGADGHDFEPIVPELRLPEDLALRFVFPHAPERPITINGGMRMRAWFDILSLGRTEPCDIGGIEASCADVEALIAAEIDAGIPPERIIVAGFSQGGVIASHVGLRAEQPFAGLMVLSSFLPLADRLADYPSKPGLPVFLAHGDLDPVLPLAMGEAVRAAMIGAGLEPEWHRYPMAHGVCPAEIEDMRGFLLRTLSA